MIGLLFGMTAIGCAVAVLAYLVLSRARAGTGVVALAGDTAIATAPRAVKAPSALRRRLAELATRVSGRGYSAKMQARLDRAGNPDHWDAQRVLALKGAGLVTGLFSGLVIGARAGGVFTLLAPVVVAALGLYMPDAWIRNLGEHRQADLQRGLPDAIDMMTVCVEAGLGFDAALSRVARNLDGPFAEECARILQEMQIGSSRAQGLRALVERTDVPELSAFVMSIVQSAQMGISIGDVLREQSKQMRIKRRQRAEERAQKLQVKLLFPLITCLLPAMFIVILGPAALKIVSFFGKGA